MKVLVDMEVKSGMSVAPQIVKSMIGGKYSGELNEIPYDMKIVGATIVEEANVAPGAATEKKDPAPGPVGNPTRDALNQLNK